MALPSRPHQAHEAPCADHVSCAADSGRSARVGAAQARGVVCRTETERLARAHPHADRDDVEPARGAAHDWRIVSGLRSRLSRNWLHVASSGPIAKRWNAVTISVAGRSSCLMWCWNPTHRHTSNAERCLEHCSRAMQCLRAMRRARFRAVPWFSRRACAPILTPMHSRFTSGYATQTARSAALFSRAW